MRVRIILNLCSDIDNLADKWVNPRNYWFQSNSHYGIEKAVCWLTVVVPLLFRCFAPQNRTGESVLSSGLFCCVQSGLPDDRSLRTKQSAWAFFGSERRLIMGKVSGKTHTKAQLDHWANLHNPNNKAYQADADNRANQMNPNHRSHQRTHNANRRNKAHWMPEWAPDYPEYDD